jgi:acetyl esterase/lipase
MTRRGALLAPLAGGLAAACSPLGALNTFAPRDRSARRVARDVAYGPGERQKLDIYAPTGARAAPLVVFFYGGGWNSGARGLYGWAAQAIASRGFVVALPDYRLVPEVRFPVFLEDCAQATAKAVELAGGHGADPAKLAVAGHSAGAYNALMLALDPRYLAAAGLPAGSVKAAAGLAGPYDFLPLDVASTREAFGQAPDLPQTQPVTFADRSDPAVWLAYGGKDRVVYPHNSRNLAARVNAAGGTAELKLYPDLDHAGMIAALAPLFRGRAPVLDDMAAFLHARLD